MWVQTQDFMVLGSVGDLCQSILLEVGLLVEWISRFIQSARRTDCSAWSFVVTNGLALVFGFLVTPLKIPI